MFLFARHTDVEQGLYNPGFDSVYILEAKQKIAPQKLLC
jgi:hypothetical protein